MTGPLLVIRDADGAERTVELRDGVMRIGRGADNEIIIGDAAKGVSRAHAELHVENGRCTIVDLHSQNGTWVNALRVQRAEVRPDQEVAIGVFRLRLQTASTPSVSATGRPGPRPQPATVVAPRAAVAGGIVAGHSGAAATAAGAARSGHRFAADVTVRRRHQSGADAGGAAADDGTGAGRQAQKIEPAVDLRRHRRPGDDWARLRAVQPSAEENRRTRGRPRAGCAAARTGRTCGRASGTAGRRASNSRRRRTSSTARSGGKHETIGEARSGETGGDDAGDRTRAAARHDRRTTDAQPAGATRAERTRDATAWRPGPSAARTAEAVRTTAENLPVPRKPGETVQEWQARSSALQARYAFAKVALDRGDFSAAAGGFAAILLEEPGFLDAPQLLVKARDGLRAAAAEMIESGNKLDTAGDWVSALKKYDQAREIDRTVPGLDEAVKRVRDKMHAAGGNALRRARQFDALGRFADALLEYEKAAQWLSPDDPNQQIARGRADQLKARQK